MMFPPSNLIKDTRTASVDELRSAPHAERMGFDEILSVLQSPDSTRQLKLDNGVLSDGENTYSLRYQIPVLLPSVLKPFFTDRLSVPLSAIKNSFLQYFYLSSIKQSGDIGDINASFLDEHYQRHLYRMRCLVQDCTGSVLDVGCDNPEIGAGLFPPTAKYIGLDPFCQNLTHFRVVGLAEFLPFLGGSFRNVVFNTSLDHILDWHRAIDEAGRVLEPGGILYISTLAWTQKADLFPDSVHFHHFREYEVIGGLEGFELLDLKRYDYKENSHRYGIYLKARKL